MRRVLSATALTAFAAALPAASAHARQQPTFRSGTELVEVDVRVVDDRGRFVTGLGQEDFEILEEGTRQSVHSVYLVDPTFAAGGADPRALSHSVPPFSQQQTWVFMFDVAHLSPARLMRGRDGVARFIDERLPAGAMGGVVVGAAMVNSRLTRDHQELKRAVLSAQPAAASAMRRADLREWPPFRSEEEALRMERPESDRDLLEELRERACTDRPEACYRSSRVETGREAQADATNAIAAQAEEHVRNEIRQKARRIVSELRSARAEVLRSATAVASGLARVPGRKAVVLFSEGFFFDDATSQVRNLLIDAARADVTFYTIDARGLNRVGDDSFEERGAMELSAAAPATVDTNADGINSLAVDTGGLVVRNENDFGRALALISTDVGTHYVLAYESSSNLPSGSFRSIEVRVKRPAVHVRARRGYVAAPRIRASAPAAEPRATLAVVAEVPDTLPGVAVDAGIPATLPSAATTATSTGAAAATIAHRRADARAATVVRIGEVLRRGAGWAAQGWAAYERGDVERASAALARAAAGPDARPWVFYALGLSLVAQQQFEPAAGAWAQVVDTAADFQPVYLDLADLYIQMGRERNAVELLREASRRWPADADVLNALGVVQVRRGGIDDAIDSFRRATESAPGDPLGHFNLARTYHLRYVRTRRYNRELKQWVGNERDRTGALAAYEACLRLGGPFDSQARDGLAVLSWK